MQELNRQFQILRQYADKYETADFIHADPSYFMHQVKGQENMETMAWLAQALSYGRRELFIPKIQLMLDNSKGAVHHWVASGDFKRLFKSGDNTSFYRLYTNDDMHIFLKATQNLLVAHGSLLNFLKAKIACSPTALNAVKALCAYYAEYNTKIIPHDATSSCKRVCMFLRWMVRSNSPVDLGLWADFIDRRTLIMPLDVHVLTQSQNLGLIQSKTTTMSAALKLTEKLRECFPDDPLKADFALFGYGVNNKK